MKRHLTMVPMALAAITLMATTATATQVETKGFLEMRGIAFDNVRDGNDAADDNSRGADQRFRLWTNAALDENVKAVFAIEIDNTWGDTGSGSKEVGKVGSDAKGQIEIKHAFLDFKLPAAAATVKAGTQPFYAGHAFIMDDDAAGVQINLELADQDQLNLSWIKTDEGSVTNDAADGDYYGVTYCLRRAGWMLAPAVAYWDRPGSDRQLYLGMDLEGKLSTVGVKASLVYNQGQIGGQDNSGIAAWAKGSVAAANNNLSLEAAYIADRDQADGQFEGISPAVNFSEVITDGKFGKRGSVGNSFQGDGMSNYLYFKAGVEHKLSSQQTVTVAYLYAKEPEGRKMTFGHELDAYFSYAIQKGLTATVGGGYLLADSSFGSAGDNAWKVGSALTYKF